MIMVGSSVNCVAKKPLIMPQTRPVARVIRMTRPIGRPALLLRQPTVAARQTIEPTEISISPRTRMKPMPNSMKISAR